MSTLSDAQIELINKIGYTSVTEMSLTLTEAETLETLKKSRLVRMRATNKYFNPDGIIWYELGKKGFALYEEMKAAPSAIAPAEDETLAGELPAIETVTSEPIVETFIPTVGKPAMYVDQRVNVSARYADGMYRIVYFDESKNQHIVTRVKGSSLSPLIEETPAILPEVAPAPTMANSLLAAKDEYIAHLEARVQELEARLALIDAAYDECAALAKADMPRGFYNASWGIRLEHLYAIVGQGRKDDTPEDPNNPTSPEGLAAWAKQRQEWIITIHSSKGETFILEGLYLSEEEALADGIKIRNERYLNWSVTLSQKYPESDSLSFEEENQNYNADLGLGSR